MSADGRSRAGRVCFVTDEFAGVGAHGGIGTHLLLLSRLLAGRGWDVHVLYCGPAPDEQAAARIAEVLALQRITITRLDAEPAPVWQGIPSYGDGMGTLGAAQLCLAALQRLHAEHRFDLIEFADRNALGFRAVQAKRSGIALADVRLAIKLHGATAWWRRSNSDLRRSPWELQIEYCERYAFEHADLQLSPSRYMIADARNEGWAVADDAVVASPFPDRRAGAPRPPGDVRELVFYGRLAPGKGLQLFLDALDRYNGDHPVLFLGGDSDIDGRAASAVIAERMGERPHRIETELDRDAALEELLEEGRLAVVPSRAESSGLTVAECIVDEIPFLASDAGAIPEVVVHDEARARWLFEPTPEGLVEALERRLTSPAAEERDLRSATAAACDPGGHNDRVADAYEALLAVPAPPAQPRRRAHAGCTVSVAVTHYHHPDYLPAALASLADQTRPPDVVLVIDDGSTDERSRRVFAEQQARYPGWTFVRQHNAGPGAARNALLARARSDYFLPFDTDNIATPALVETLLTAAEADRRDATTCHMLGFTEEQDIAAGRFSFRYAPTGGPRVLTLLENVFGDTCGLFRTEALRAVGGFETARWSPHEDWETYTKLAFAGFRVDVVPRVLFFYRAEIGGRLDRLGTESHQAYRLRERMIHELLADAELDRDERILLWQCLLGFAHPQAELVALQRSQDELADWAYKTIDEIHEWRRAQLEELRAFLTVQIDAATSRAERAEAEVAALRREQAQSASVRPGRRRRREDPG